MRKQTPQIRLRNECIALQRRVFFKNLRERTCPICKDEPIIDMHHLIGRDYWRRPCFWHKLNLLGVGRACHKNPARIKQWLKKNRPKQYRWLQDQLEIIQYGTKPIPIDLKMIRKSLLKQL